MQAKKATLNELLFDTSCKTYYFFLKNIRIGTPEKSKLARN